LTLAHFKINANSGEITTNISLDAEATPTFTLHVSVDDCSSNTNVSEACDLHGVIETSKQPNQTVIVTVTDMNDNPPIFTRKEVTVGMRRIVEVRHNLDLSLKVCRRLARCFKIMDSLWPNHVPYPIIKYNISSFSLFICEIKDVDY